MSGERRFQINSAQVLSVSTFFARQMLVSNLLPRWLYFRIGGSDIPTAANADLSVPPLTVQLVPLPTTNMVAVGLGPIQTTLGQQVSAGQNAVVTLYDTPLPVGIGSIDLNPTRLGQSIQQTFVAASSFTLTFPATMIHVQNYTGSWLYVAFGTLVVPTAATQMASVPPMSERSIPCPPNTLFAFGFSTDLVTKGQAVPAGIQVITTFYEYPVPIAIGTADLNPSKMGTSKAYPVTGNLSINPVPFPATQMYVSNYLARWIYFATDIPALIASAPEMVLNPGFEIPGAMPPTFANWLQSAAAPAAGPGHPPSATSCQMTAVGASQPNIGQIITVIPTRVCNYTFWYRDNGTALRYQVLDVTHGVDIISPTALALSVPWAQLSVEFTVPAGCVSIEIIFYAPAAAGPTVWVDDVSLKYVTPTDTNNQGAIAPLSEKSISLAPVTRVEIGVGTQTVMAATNVPTSTSMVTLYEYPIPITLGVAPLSPGGFRTRINLRTAQNLNNGDTISVDLSNFTYFRYSITAPAGPAVRWGIVIYALLGGAGYTLAALPPMRAGGEGSCLGNAGTIIQIQFITDTNPVSVTDIIEAWS